MSDKPMTFSKKQIIIRIFCIFFLSAGIGAIVWHSAPDTKVYLAASAQIVDAAPEFSKYKMALAGSIFITIITTTLLFWNYRLPIAFIGIAILLGGNVFSLRQMIISTELDIILFLIGMMTMVGVLKDIGLFTWIIQRIIGFKKMTGQKLFSLK